MQAHNASFWFKIFQLRLRIALFLHLRNSNNLTIFEIAANFLCYATTRMGFTLFIMALAQVEYYPYFIHPISHPPFYPEKRSRSVPRPNPHHSENLPPRPFRSIISAFLEVFPSSTSASSSLILKTVTLFLVVEDIQPASLSSLLKTVTFVPGWSRWMPKEGGCQLAAFGRWPRT
jgi:hypothetical protein